MSANPNLTPDQVESILESTADDLIAGTDWHMYYGHGRINAANAVQLALNTTAADNQVPVTTIFSPGINAVAKGNVLVEVSATDNIGVNEVSLYANGVLVASDMTAPYQFSWDSTQELDGMVILTAKAKDAALNEGVSSDVAIEVQNVVPVEDFTAPIVVINNPVNGATVSRAVDISIEATDNAQISEIQLSIDGVVVSTVTTSSMNYSWNTRKVADGAHSISAVATDSSSNTSEVVAIGVMIGGSTTTTNTTTKGRKK